MAVSGPAALEQTERVNGHPMGGVSPSLPTQSGLSWRRRKGPVMAGRGPSAYHGVSINVVATSMSVAPEQLPLGPTLLSSP